MLKQLLLSYVLSIPLLSMTDDVFYVNNQYYHNYQNNPLLAINQDYESYLDIHEIDVKKNRKVFC